MAYRSIVIQIAVFASLSIVAGETWANACPDGDQIKGRYIIRISGSNEEVSTGLSTKNVDSAISNLISKGIQLNWIHESPGHSPLTTQSLKTGSSQETSGAPLASVATVDLPSDEVAQSLISVPGVLSIEPDCRVHLNALPNDFPNQNQWAQKALRLEEAWDLVRDASSVIVAVSDTGIEYEHEDLSANIWGNKAEINGVLGYDDDGNGCVDDFHGCDLADQDGDPIPNSTTLGSHGTHVAGIIGAVGNNRTGVSGVAWRVKLLAAKGFSSLDDSASLSDLLRTIYYSVNQGARIINCSWGLGRKPGPAETDAFRYALNKGVLPVVAAGNESMDAANTSPAAIPGVLSVGSINSLDQISSFSNFGSTVSIFAPGGESKKSGGPFDEYIESTIPSLNGVYGSMRGTSMAAPYVSGIAALMIAANPTLMPGDIIRLLRDTARTVTSSTPTGVATTILIADAQQAVQAALNFKTPPTTSPKCPECTTDLPSTTDSSSMIHKNENATGGCSLGSIQADASRTASAALGVTKTDSALFGSILLGLPALLSLLLRQRRGSSSRRIR